MDLIEIGLEDDWGLASKRSSATKERVKADRQQLQSTPLAFVPVAPARRRDARRHLLWAYGLTAISLISWTGIASVTLVTSFRLLLALMSMTIEQSTMTILVTWLILLISAVVLFASPVLRTLGIATRGSFLFSNARSVSRWRWSTGRIGKSHRFSSLAQQLRSLRSAIIILSFIPIVVSLVHAILSPIDRNTPASEYDLIGFLFALCFLILGWGLWIVSPVWYRETRGHQLHRSLRYYHRGVALRSFIAAWDNPSRNIYQSCRLSCRLATAHRTIFLTTAGCFGLAGCITARIDSIGYLGELASVICIAMTLMLWPTSQRLVNWSAVILDPFCSDPEEYEEY